MSDKKLKLTIGAFVLSGLILLVASILIVGGNYFNTENPKFVLYFKSSLKGLIPGAPVYFKGIRIGKVHDILIYYDNDKKSEGFKTPVIIEIEPEKEGSKDLKASIFAGRDIFQRKEFFKAVIRNGLRAQLASSSILTGQLCIEMDIFPSASPVDPDKLEEYQGHMQIPTQLSTLDAALASLEHISIEELLMNISDTMKHLNQQLTSIEFTKITDSLQSLLDNSNRDINKLNDVIEHADNLMVSYTNLGQKLEETLPKTVDNANNTLVSVNHLIKTDVKRLLQSVTQTSDTAQRFLAGKTLPMIELTTTLQAIKKAAQAIGELSVNLEIRPNSLIFGRKSK